MVANEQVEEAGVNNKEDKEARKRELEQKQDDEVRALLTPGVIVTMHRDATWEEEPVLQLMAKKMVNGKLVSVTMSDGSHVSANIEPSEETMAKALKAVEQYDLVKIRSASVQKSKMILHDIEHIELSDENDAHIPIHGAVKAVGVESLRILKQEALDLWGVRFETEERSRCRRRRTTWRSHFCRKTQCSNRWEESAGRTRLKENAAAGPRGSL